MNFKMNWNKNQTNLRMNLDMSIEQIILKKGAWEKMSGLKMAYHYIKKLFKA